MLEEKLNTQNQKQKEQNRRKNKMWRNKKGVLFVYAIAVIGIALIAVFWFIWHYIFWLIQPVAKSITYDLNTNGTSYDQVDTFFQTYDNYAAVIALMVLFIFVAVYSQRRGQEV